MTGMVLGLTGEVRRGGIFLLSITFICGMELRETAQSNTYPLAQLLIASPYATIYKINQLHTYYVFDTGLHILRMGDRWKDP